MPATRVPGGMFPSARHSGIQCAILRDWLVVPVRPAGHDHVHDLHPYPGASGLHYLFQKYSLVRGGTFVNPIFASYTRAFTMFGGIFTTAIKNTISIRPLYRHDGYSPRAHPGQSDPAAGRQDAHLLPCGAYYLPAVTSALIVGMTWAYVFNGRWGLLPTMSRLSDCRPLRWLSNPDIALGSVTLSAMLTYPGHRGGALHRGYGRHPPGVLRGARAGRCKRDPQVVEHHLPPSSSRPRSTWSCSTDRPASRVFERIYRHGAERGRQLHADDSVTQIYNNGFKDFNFGVASRRRSSCSS